MRHKRQGYAVLVYHHQQQQVLMSFSICILTYML